MTTAPFREKLDARIAAADSLLCVGLDPVLSKLPSIYDDSPRSVVSFCNEIVDATHQFAAAYKPNLAFFLALGMDGVRVLRRVLERIPDDIPVILDAKVNDLGETAKAYASFFFDELGVDAITSAPWMGEDAMEPYLTRRGKGIIILCKTSNTGSGDFLDQPLANGLSLSQFTAERSREWHAKYPSHVGLVVGATFPHQLADIRERCPDQVILLPGLGAQGGDTQASVVAGTDHQGGGLLCSASRSIMFASDASDFAVDAHIEAQRLRNTINAARPARSSIAPD